MIDLLASYWELCVLKVDLIEVPSDLDLFEGWWTSCQKIVIFTVLTLVKGFIIELIKAIPTFKLIKKLNEIKM